MVCFYSRGTSVNEFGIYFFSNSFLQIYIFSPRSIKYDLLSNLHTSFFVAKNYQPLTFHFFQVFQNFKKHIG